MSNSKSLNYYSTPGNITKLNKYADFLSWLSDDPRVIFQVVQGLLIHDVCNHSF